MSIRLTTPVTIITGHLGAGKTTLINRVLRESHGERIAVIENEFGAVGVDAEFLAESGAERIIQLANGCLCCTVRGDLARALESLITQARAGGFVFDRILIETSGLADPGPVIQTFLAETALEEHVHLDGVVTLVDAVNFEAHALRSESKAQIAYADRLLLTKHDLNTESESVVALLNVINPRAPLTRCDILQMPIGKLLAQLLNIAGFSRDYVPREEMRQAISVGKNRFLATAPTHDEHAVSYVFRDECPINLEALNAFIDSMIEEYGARLWRCKGVVNTGNHRTRLVLQGVQGAIHLNGGTVWRPYEPRETVLVFIGDRLDTAFIQEGLANCLAQDLQRRPN
jgi:G3E family GTPase